MQEPINSPRGDQNEENNLPRGPATVTVPARLSSLASVNSPAGSKPEDGAVPGDIYSDQLAPANPPSSASLWKVSFNIAVVIFSLLVSLVYAVLAYLRGEGDVGLSFFYAFCALIENFPQYIFVPKKLMQRLTEMRLYGFYPPRIAALLFGAYAMCVTVESALPLSRDAAKKAATFMHMSPTASVTKPIEALFGAALALTRGMGALVLFSLAYMKILRPILAKFDFFSGERHRHFLLQVLAHLKASPEACPNNDAINEVWLRNFYGQQTVKTMLQQEAKCRVLSWKTAEHASVFLLSAGCSLLMPMWLALAERGIGSDKSGVVWSAAVPNQIFYLWFCMTLPSAMGKSTKRLAHYLRESCNLSAAASWMASLFMQIVVAGGIAYASGGSYAAEATKEMDHTGFGGVSDRTLHFLYPLIQRIHHTIQYGNVVDFYAGFVANGGAVWNTMIMYADDMARFEKIPGFSKLESVGETTFGHKGWNEQLADADPQKKIFEDCVKALTFFDPQVGDWGVAMQIREAAQSGDVTVDSDDEAPPRSVGAGTDTSAPLLEGVIQ